jgi:hypothetical protein
MLRVTQSSGFGAGDWTPALISPEFWIDPSDLSTLWQEITGGSATTPSGVGDRVGSIRNKGSLGGWLTAADNTQRPFLRQVNGAFALETAEAVTTQMVSGATLLPGNAIISTSTGWDASPNNRQQTIGLQGGSDRQSFHAPWEDLNWYSDVYGVGQRISGLITSYPNNLVATQIVSGGDQFFRLAGSQVDTRSAGSIPTSAISFVLNPGWRNWGVIMKTGAIDTATVRNIERWLARKGGFPL